jgi:hypothetical protein
MALDDSSDPPDYYCRLCQVSFYFLQDGTICFAVTGNPKIAPEDREKYFKKEFPHFEETFAWGQPKP